MSYPARRVPLTARELDAAVLAADPARDVLILLLKMYAHAKETMKDIERGMWLHTEGFPI